MPDHKSTNATLRSKSETKQTLKTVGYEIFAAVRRNERRGVREEDGGWGEHVQRRGKERFNNKTKVKSE